jgi:two-component system NtrC family sensor kinase
MALRTERLLRAAQDARLLAVDSFRDFPRHLQAIEQDIFRCKKIISSLQDFSGVRTPELRTIELGEIAEKAARLASHPFHLKQVELALELEAGLPPLRGDEDQLRQAVLALLMNARDATPAGGRVRVSTGAGQDVVRLSVTDEGAGIPPEIRDRVFTPFFTTKPPGQGTGLGLPVCHGIVAAHGGRIEVDSTMGPGTRVSLVLPIAGPARPATAPGSER